MSKQTAVAIVAAAAIGYFLIRGKGAGVIPCSVDSDCSGQTPRCNPTTGSCVGCLGDGASGDCPPGRYCYSHKCVECLNNNHCPTGYCDSATRSCMCIPHYGSCDGAGCCDGLDCYKGKCLLAKGSPVTEVYTPGNLGCVDDGFACQFYEHPLLNGMRTVGSLDVEFVLGQPCVGGSYDIEVGIARPGGSIRWLFHDSIPLFVTNPKYTNIPVDEEVASIVLRAWLQPCLPFVGCLGGCQSIQKAFVTLA